MAKAAEPRFLIVTSGFECDLGVFLPGEVVESSHPAVRRYPASFGPLVLPHPVRATEPVIETATAAPGEKRGA